MTVYTIGHSNRPLETFIEVLQAYGIEALVDIRTVPKSRANPQFWGTSLAETLPEADISYHRIDGLGGLRSKSRNVPPAVNEFWENQSFHNYADWALGPQFHQGFIELEDLASTQITVIMCAEVLWWRCHRRIVADYLLTSGHEVTHIFDEKHQEPAKLTSAAVVQRTPDLFTIEYPKPE